MVHFLMKGGVVYTNVKLNWDAVLAYAKKHGIDEIPEANYRYVHDGSLTNFQRNLTVGCAVYWDEAQLIWNSRDYRKTDEAQREMLEFLTQARHLKVTVNFITQHEGNVDTQVSRIAVYIIRLRNLLHYPVAMFFYQMLGKPRWLQVSFAAVCDRDGKTVMDKERFIRDDGIGSCYDTTQMHMAGGQFVLAGPAAQAVKGKVTYGHPGLLFIIIGLILCTVAWFLRPEPEVVPEVRPVAVAPPEKPVPQMMDPPRVVEREPKKEPGEKLTGIKRFGAASGENWSTEEESMELPRWWKVTGARLVLVNRGRPVVRGSFWLGGQVQTFYSESSDTVVVVLVKPENPTLKYYARIYRYDVGLVVRDRSRVMDGGSAVLLNPSLENVPPRP